MMNMMMPKPNLILALDIMWTVNPTMNLKLMPNPAMTQSLMQMPKSMTT